MEEIGRELRRRREELGLSLQDVQAAIKIRTRYLAALEAGDPGVIPGEVFVKGFLKVYADYLGLSGAEYVGRYKAWLREQAGTGQSGGAEGSDGREAPVGATEPRRDSRSVSEDEPGSGRAATWAALRSARRRPSPAREAWTRLLPLGALAALGAVLYLAAVSVFGTWDLQKAGPGNGQGRRQTAESAASPAGGGRSSLGSAPQQAPAPPPPAAAGTDGSAAPAAPVVVMSRAGSVVHYAVYGWEALRVKAEFAGRCWVAVRADGRLVLERTLEAGESLEWTAAEEVRIRAGRPDMVRLSLDGKALEHVASVEPLDLVIRRAPRP